METGLSGKAKRVRIYVSEGDSFRHQPVGDAIVAFLRKEGASGATVFRGVEGFGASGVVHTSRLVEIAQHLPIVIEWIEQSDVVDRLLPQIKGLIKRGLITVEDTNVEFYCSHPVRDVPAALRVSDVMSREVVSVAPGASLRSVVELMVGKVRRAVPVVEQGAPVGIITNSDLVRRGGLGMRLELLQLLGKSVAEAELARLTAEGKTAEDVMTSALVVVPVTAPLTQVAEIMSFRRLKRLPVVDERSALVGIVSRVDVLRTAIRAYEPSSNDNPQSGLAVDGPVSRAMRTDVPVVFPDAAVADVVQAITATRLHRCLVVDRDRRVLGKITDAEVLERITPALRPSALRSFIHRLPFAHPKPEDVLVEQHATARSAADLMVMVPKVAEDASVRDAIAAMVKSQHKIVAVIDRSQRLVGVLDRADLLHSLILPDSDAV